MLTMGPWGKQLCSQGFKSARHNGYGWCEWISEREKDREREIVYKIPRCCLQVHEHLAIRRFHYFFVKQLNLTLWSEYVSNKYYHVRERKACQHRNILWDSLSGEMQVKIVFCQCYRIASQWNVVGVVSLQERWSNWSETLVRVKAWEENLPNDDPLWKAEVEVGDEYDRRVDLIRPWRRTRRVKYFKTKGRTSIRKEGGREPPASQMHLGTGVKSQLWIFRRWLVILSRAISEYWKYGNVNLDREDCLPLSTSFTTKLKIA